MSPPAADLAHAARRLVEFDSIRSKLRDTRQTALSDMDKCVHTYRLKFSGRRELRRDLNECEWSIYQYASLLHMLGEMVDRTHDEFGTRLEQHAPIEHEMPKLVGLRHAVHHNGLVGVNIAEVDSFPDPVVVVPVTSIERHGSWGDGNPAFSTFFHDVSGDAFALAPVVENSAEPVEGIVDELERQLTEQFGDDELRRAATNVQLYD
ncbi:hypothetical protein [Halomicrobium sp. LC1Hm]|uniref:hypothetical protein n=1 Tax=Halomicrobium sp. LC1Hm TaxID=2610902 RepID=UPI0012A812C0|nr:hypothetical protein [Halomicrobium sp. LC1Hm]QGA81372.1 hypothetical protein LC1Hm_0306 [Halomicrobium sp. LC1Hm]